MKVDGPVWALGSMSGTSVDGVDAALVLTDGIDVLEFGRAGYRPYAARERDAIRGAMGRWPGEAGVAGAARVVEEAHAELLSSFEADIAGFHGQTLAHEPGGRGTHQAGDGAALARALGVPVAWDFRSRDVELGGQGAPLAPFFHHAAARWAGESGPVAVLNVGGVANVTWLDPARPAEDCVAFDTGPGNAPLDDLVRTRRGAAFDEDGALAMSGTPDAAVVREALDRPFFRKAPPKSLDRDAFRGLAEKVARLSDADAAATLARIAAAGAASALEWLPPGTARLLVAGGGRRNRAIMSGLEALAPMRVDRIEAWGLDGDMVEAQAFAYLAVRAARGLALTAPGTTGVPAPAPGGRVDPPGPGGGAEGEPA